MHRVGIEALTEQEKQNCYKWAYEVIEAVAIAYVFYDNPNIRNRYLTTVNAKMNDIGIKSLMNLRKWNLKHMFKLARVERFERDYVCGFSPFKGVAAANMLAQPPKYSEAGLKRCLKIVAGELVKARHRTKWCDLVNDYRRITNDFICLHRVVYENTGKSSDYTPII